MNLHPHHGALPEVHPTAWVAPGAHLIGDVHVAEGASIWFGAILRGDVCSISVGRFSNVQDNTVVHAESAHGAATCQPCRIGDNVTIGHAVVVHGCIIEDRVLVGMGSVLMNGAVIHSDTIIGAKALVPEGREIPGRSLLLGMPAKVARALEEAEIRGIVRSAQDYAKLAGSYWKGE
ncbi:MAG: gamma carbonic anhydrase family protein [Chloroflexota bacterium]|nr:gamma carbonic anhydrase family protein [Chloroflexota bacterium]